MYMLVYYQFNTCSALYHHFWSRSHIHFSEDSRGNYLRWQYVVMLTVVRVFIVVQLVVFQEGKETDEEQFMHCKFHDFAVALCSKVKKRREKPDEGVSSANFICDEMAHYHI